MAVNEQETPAGIVFESHGDLYAVAVDGTRTVRLTHTLAQEDAPAVSADGRSIAFTTSANRGIWIMSIDGKMRKRLTIGHDDAPAWSPDGKTLFFERPFNSYFTPPHQKRRVFTGVCDAIFRIGTKGQHLRRLKTWGAANYDPAVSPDGSRIAFSATNACEGGTAVYGILVMNPSGQRTSDLARLPLNDLTFPSSDFQSPTWSPDGSRLAFHPWGGGIETANRDGTDRRRITPKQWNGSTSPSWSPDGTWIAFTAYPGNVGHVYVIHPDGTGFHRLRTTKASEGSPAWISRMPAG